MNLDRRWFLRGLGATLASAPFARMLEGEALAADPGTARRLVVFFSPNGTIHHQRRPTGSGSSFAFPAGSILEPLTAIKDKLVVVDGLDFHEASNHEGGMRAMLTGNGRAGDVGNGASIDQHVAQSLGTTSRFASLELGVQTSAWGGSTQTRMCYSDAGSFITPDDDPTHVFGRLFGTGDADAAARARLRDRRASVFGLAMDDIENLHARLGSAEQRKLEAHLDALSVVQTSLGEDLSCAAPTPPAAVANKNDHNVMDVVMRQQVDLLVAGLACDATRVATLQAAHTVAPHVLSFAGLSAGHHTLSHSGDGDAAGVDGFRVAERWFAEQFRYLVERLDTTPDPAGGMLLDSTIVVWAKEMGDCRLHTCQDVPFVIAGSANGRWQTGQYLRFNGEPHNHLWVSVAQAMGLSDDTFGNPTYGSGPLPGLA